MKHYIKPVGLAIVPVLIILVVLSLVIPSDTLAGPQVTTTANDQTNIAITIYNEGTGLVKDTRNIDLPEGQFDLIFMDVASSIDPTSVHFVSNTDPDSIAILEQNYEYDLVSTSALYTRHIDHPITVRTEDGRTIDGTLLSYDGSLVIQTPMGINIVNNPVEVQFEDLPEGLITRPTLRWSLISGDNGLNECEMSYLTGGLTWTANYVAVVNEDDDELDLSGWVTIDNTSGSAYYDAELKLVAGEINRVKMDDELAYLGTDMMFEGEMYMNGGGGFEEESFFEYHLYTLQRPADIGNNQQKQISLLEGEGVDVEKILVFDPGYQYYYSGDSAEGVIQVNLNFENSEENGLGIPLPEGILRVYKEDSSGALQFIGEDRIDHTPKDENIEIFLGEAFDIVGTRTVLDRRQIRNDLWEYDVEVTIRNHKEEDIDVLYFDHVYGDWDVRASSLDYDQRDASTLEFEIPVDSDGETVLTYTIRLEW